MKRKKNVEIYTRNYKDKLFRQIELECGLEDLTEEELQLPILERRISERSIVYRSILGDTEDFRVMGKVVQVGNITQLTPYRTFRLENPPAPEYRLENMTPQRALSIQDGIVHLKSKGGNYYQAPLNRHIPLGTVAHAQKMIRLHDPDVKVTAYVKWADDNPEVVGLEVEDERHVRERIEVQGRLDISCL